MPVEIGEMTSQVEIQPPARVEGGQPLPRELVRQVAERVYALLQEELRLSHERRRDAGLKGVRYER